MSSVKSVDDVLADWERAVLEALLRAYLKQLVAK
jgi:hypothetical protein